VPESNLLYYPSLTAFEKFETATFLILHGILACLKEAPFGRTPEGAVAYVNVLFEDN